MDSLLVFATLLGLIVIGAPIFLALGAAGLLGLYLARGHLALTLAPTSFFGQLNSFELIALPLFVLMGYVLVETPIGKHLFRAASYWLNWLRGGLAISSVGACTIFGAISGVSIAGVASVGALAVPEMMKHGYSRSLASGSVVTAGAIAMLIPPSVPFIIYSAVSGVSIADLFIGGIVPGLALALAFSVFINVRATLRPEEAPRVEEAVSWRDRFASLSQVWHALLLMVIVLGSIYSGLATPTEASAVGAGGAFLIAGLIFRTLTWQSLRRILRNSLSVSTAILMIMGAARIFGDYLNLVRIPQTITAFVLGFDVPPEVVFILIMLLLIGLGMFVDAASLIVVVTPILLPLVTSLGYDPLWFGIVLVMNLEIAVVTPPVGLNLYTLRGVCPFLSIEEIVRSAIPFVLIQILVLLVFVLFPPLALWLPYSMY
jgi:C4-dicarboxylate transporter DctM subunit